MFPSCGHITPEFKMLRVWPGISHWPSWFQFMHRLPKIFSQFSTIEDIKGFNVNTWCKKLVPLCGHPDMKTKEWLWTNLSSSIPLVLSTGSAAIKTKTINVHTRLRFIIEGEKWSWSENSNEHNYNTTITLLIIIWSAKVIRIRRNLHLYII